MAKCFGENQTLQPYTYLFSDSAAIRVYPDSRPHNLKIAALQKGLILLFRNRELVGEGIGFGGPIIKYSDQTYYSSDAMLQISQNSNGLVIQKEYHLNTIRRSQTDNLQNRALQNRINALNRVYQNNKQVAALVLKSKTLLSPFAHHSRFAAAPSRGTVVATYTINPNHIEVNMDFSGLKQENLTQIIVLNEQGAHFFRDYIDSDGLSLQDEAIGVWDPVFADQATISDPRNGLAFTLKKAQNAVLRRGREVAEGMLDWIGLDYELPPKTRQFNYEIMLSGVKI